MSTLIEQAHAREWFYSFELPDGSTTPTYHGSDIKAIHDTRWQMLQSCLDERLGNQREGLTALDLASHQGWFAVNMARSRVFQRTGCRCPRISRGRQSAD